MLALPVQIIYGLTGSFWAIALVVASPAAYIFFQGDMEAPNATMDSLHSLTVKNTDRQTSLSKIYEKAKSEIPNNHRISAVELNTKDKQWNKIVFTAQSHSDGLLRDTKLAYDMQGNLLKTCGPTESVGAATIETTVRLHFATIFGTWFKYLMLALSLIATYSLACGINIWLSRTQNVKKKIYYKAVQTICFAVVAGTLISLACSFHVSLSSPENAKGLFWYFMAACGMLPLFLNTEKAYKLGFLLSAVLYLCLPIHHAVKTASVSNIFLAGNIFFLLIAAASCIFAKDVRLIGWTKEMGIK